MAFVGDVALHPGNGRQARAAKDRPDMVQAGGRVGDEVARPMLGQELRVAVADGKLAALVFLGIAEEQRQRDVGPDAAG